MTRHRFFLTHPFPQACTGARGAAPLSAEDAHHALRVLRLRPAEEIDLVEPSGVAWHARVLADSAQPTSELRVELVEQLVVAPEPDVTLVFGVLKGGKNEDVIEGAVEVGVASLLPALTDRCIVKLDAAKRADRGDRWRRVARAAAKQSKRSRVPHVADPAPLGELVATLADRDLVIVAWEDAHGAGLAQRLAEASPAPGARIAVIVGPEGGLTADEVAAMVAAGAVTCTLGPTILRAETAAVVAAALAVHELGGLGGPACELAAGEDSTP